MSLATTFATAAEATGARAEFPHCGTCGAGLKVQRTASAGAWQLTCTKQPSHAVSVLDEGPA